MQADSEDMAMRVGSSPVEGIPPPSSPAPRPPREIWTARDLLLFVGFIPFALLVAKLIVLLGYAALRPLAGWQLKVDLVQTNTVFLLLQQSVFYMLILGFLVLLARLQHQQPFWKSVGWKKPATKEVVGYLVGGGLLAGAVSLALVVWPDTQAFPLEKLFNSRIASFAIGAFAISFAPVEEELVFRGLFFAILERAAGLRLAVVVTAVLFAGLHVPEYWHAWNHLFMILVVGMVFSLARGTTGSIAPSIMLHIGYNSLIMTGLFFSSQHFRTASGFWAP